jgi:phosphatidylserine/phosphatidylglycerophosphate/cardiolipin synthase-like enzyme
MSALASIGILKEDNRVYLLNETKLFQTEGYRTGAQEALALRTGADHEQPLLFASVPSGLSSAAEQEVRAHAADLRAGVVDMILSARERIVLASPFWDPSTADELGVLLSRRLEAGVAVDILGRFGTDDEALKTLTSLLSGHRHVRLFSWHVADPDDPFGSQTFHFKAVVADDGDRAYIGSANLTISGLRSRMELGILLRGEPALKVARILEVVLSLSRIVKRPGAQGR